MIVCMWQHLVRGIKCYGTCPIGESGEIGINNQAPCLTENEQDNDTDNGGTNTSDSLEKQKKRHEIRLSSIIEYEYKI